MNVIHTFVRRRQHVHYQQSYAAKSNHVWTIRLKILDYPLQLCEHMATITLNVSQLDYHSTISVEINQDRLVRIHGQDWFENVIGCFQFPVFRPWSLLISHSNILLDIHQNHIAES